MNKKLVIIGASGHGKVVGDIAMLLKRWETIVYLDDDENLKVCLGFQVIGKTKSFIDHVQDSDFFVAIGNNNARESFFNKIDKAKGNLVTLIHPNAVIGSFVSIDKGSVVMAGVVVNPQTTIGKGCIINTSCSIDHDNVIGDFVHVSPGAHLAGSVTIGRRTWVGINATVIQSVSVCNDVILGAGSVTTKSISESGTYVGIPGKKIK